jgi:glycerate kinase
MMKIGIAPDSFKGSLTALEAASCIERGLRKALPGIRTVKIPMADGGEGTVRAIAEATGGRMIKRPVSDPLGKRVQALYGITGDGSSAVIEMAAASGLALLKPAERNPMITSTFGTGELILAALRAGAQRILIGIGGSATNDGGTGMAQALGVRFLDRNGLEIKQGGGFLKKLHRIDMDGLIPVVRRAAFEVACDVDNPLVGPKGAARVYAPQKGATPRMVDELDSGLRHLAKIIRRDLDVDILTVPGAGAAGGLGAGLMAFLGARLRPGVNIVMDAVELSRKLTGCSLVIAGEGRMDGQTVFGKAPAGVARVARKLKIPVIAICGSLGEGFSKVHAIGIAACFASLERPLDEEELPKLGPAMLERCAEEVGRLIALTPGFGQKG